MPGNRNYNWEHKQATNWEALYHISQLHCWKTCLCLLCSISNMKVSFSSNIRFIFQAKLSRRENLFRKHFFYLLVSLTFTSLKLSSLVLLFAASAVLWRHYVNLESQPVHPTTACQHLSMIPSWHGCDAGIRWPTGSYQCHTKPSIFSSTTVTPDRAPPAMSSQSAAQKHVSLD